MVALSTLLLVPSGGASADPCLAGLGCTRTACRECGPSPTVPGALACVRKPIFSDGACGCTLQGNPPFACGETGECFYSDDPCIKTSTPNPGCRYAPPSPPSRTATLSGHAHRLGRQGLRITFPSS